MTGLREALIVAAGLIGKPDPEKIDQLIQAGNTATVTETIVAAKQDLPDNWKKSSLAWALKRAASQIERDVNATQDAERIPQLLPQIEEIIANWNNPDAAPRAKSDIPESANPIHELQVILGVSHDGAFGPATAKALLAYETAGIIDGFAGEHTIDTTQFNNLNWFLIDNAPDGTTARNQALEAAKREVVLEAQLGAQSQAFNDLITAEFERCTGEVIDLGDDNPFADILQRVAPFAQISEETPIAHERLASAINTECGRYLEQAPESLREELVEALASKLEAPINDAVKQLVTETNRSFLEDTRQLYEQAGFRRGYTVGKEEGVAPTP